MRRGKIMRGRIMTIKQLLTSNCTVKASRTIKYIVVHYVGATGGAEANAKHFASNKLSSSAHYFVGHESENATIYQSVLDKDVAWHCGTAGTYYHPECRNDNSIGVELCCHQESDGTWSFDLATVTIATELIKSLMKKYNIPMDSVIRHYDVTHKICPEPFVRNSENWQLFKRMLVEPEGDALHNVAMKAGLDEAHWRVAAEYVKYLDVLFERIWAAWPK